jgi:ubiquitin-activating enzyme E1
MIGAGALGCEQLKNFALMGVGTRGDGRVIVTDMDQIERSNLSRQFLFRNSDIGQMKSTAAAAAARAMNPEFRVDAHTNRLAADTLNVYNDAFYESLSGVCNALDNVPARVFSDSRCLLYHLPLMDGGTLGTNGDFQPIVPDVTGHYRAPGAEERGIPMCTLHHFPTSIEHTTMWAKDVFAGFFDDGPRAAQKAADDGFAARARADEAAAVATLEAAKTFLATERCESFADCVRWARLKFEQLFNWKIRDLQRSYPEDAVTDEGLPFWSGSKRYPRATVFDPADPVHALFVTAGSQIRARVSGIAAGGDVLALAAAVEVPPWAATSPPADPDFGALLAAVEAALVTPAAALPEEFEKDDDANGHVDFIAAAANIRALNYGIEPKERLAIKKIAGRIIPALATTTAMVCGFISLELYKVHALEQKKVGLFRHGVLDLSGPFFNLMIPREPEVQYVSPKTGRKYTVWDSWRLEGDLTLRELLAALEEKFGVTPECITAEAGCFYGMLPDDDPKMVARFERRVSEILATDFAAPLADGQTLLKIELVLPDAYTEEEAPPPVVLKVR